MKIYMEHKKYIKDGNKWILDYDYGKKEISEATFLRLTYEKWKGDRRTFKYIPNFGRMMTRLTNVEDIYRENKSVRDFTFED